MDRLLRSFAALTLTIVLVGSIGSTVRLTSSDEALGSAALRAQTTLDATPAPDRELLASDAFGRSVVDGWGAADAGGAYHLTDEDAVAFAVDGTAGTLTLNTERRSLSAVLDGVQALGTDHLFRVAIDPIPTGGGINVYHLARIGDDGQEYRARLTFMPDGRLRVGLDKVIPDQSGATDVGAGQTVPDLTYAATQGIWFRARFEGAGPTVIRLRVWADGSPEPADWIISATDAEPALQSAGAVGILATVSGATTTPTTTLRFDDYTVHGIDIPATTPVAAATPVASPVVSTESAVVMAAGDISCGADTPPSPCLQMGTSDLILAEDPDAVLALGDIQYECGELEDFETYFDPSWGRFKDLIRPAIGNHEYQVSQDTTGDCYGLPRGAPGHWTYFGDAASPLEPGCRVDCQGWYSFDLGAWHIVALNSNCSQIGGCGPDSPQAQWLQADLAAHPTSCTLAFWHHPFVSSGNHGSFDRYYDFWQILYQAGVDVALVGHDHHYERFVPIDTARQPDLEYGIRQFLVGTGGKNLTGLNDVTGLLPISEVYDDETFGILKLTLRSTGYDWSFVPLVEEGADPFTDTGAAECHDAPPESVAPPPLLTFADDFESGTLDDWSSISGLVVQRDEVTGNAVARCTTAGVECYARRTLDPPQAELYYRLSFMLLTQGDNPVNLLRFRTPDGSSIIGLHVTPSGQLGLRNDVGRETIRSDLSLLPGLWHEIQVHLWIRGLESQIEVWYHGAQVESLSLVLDLGTTPIGHVDLGDSATGRSFDITFDEVAVGPRFISRASPEPALPDEGDPVGSPAPAVPEATPRVQTMATGRARAPTRGVREDSQRRRRLHPRWRNGGHHERAG